MAAKAIGVEPGQIAKTIAFALKNENIIIVSKGDAKIDNRKYKNFFNTKAKMLASEDVLEVTGHPVDGVCPFGLKKTLKIYLDNSLKEYEYVYPAGGSAHTAVKIDLYKLQEVTNGTWVEVCKTDKQNI